MAAVQWGIMFVKNTNRYIARKLDNPADLAAARNGTDRFGKGVFASREAAHNAARTRAVNQGRETAIKARDLERRRYSKRLGKSKKANEALKLERAGKPWITAEGNYVELTQAQILRLTRPQAIGYRKALKKMKEKKKLESIRERTAAAEATPSFIPRVAKKAKIFPAARSATGSAKGGAAKLTTAAASMGAGGYAAGSVARNARAKSANAAKADNTEAPKVTPKKNYSATTEADPLPKDTTERPAPKPVASKPVASKKKTPKKAAPQASLKDKYETAQSKHGKYSEQAGKALGDLHGIDISYDYPNMSADEMQEGLDKGTVSKKLYGKEGKLTQAERDEINERRDMRRGGSISSDSYKLRKKSSKAKSGRASKQTSWNY